LNQAGIAAQDSDTAKGSKEPTAEINNEIPFCLHGHIFSLEPDITNLPQAITFTHLQPTLAGNEKNRTGHFTTRLCLFKKPPLPAK
jgi:hypothetical protein